ncbi:MAG: helix-turn-helix domain-containing protein [Candidatus Heimdallarchaeaceae archaeon]
MQHSKNMLTKKIKEKSSIQGIVVSSRRVYVYSDEVDQEIELENLLINLLDENGPLTRNELVALTHIPRSTLYDNLAKMISKGVIEKEAIPRSTRGRPKVLFKLA